MTTLIMTRHGETRLSQRGFRKTDLEVLLAHGTDIGRNRIMLRRRDAAELIRDLKQQIAKIERLTDKVLIVVEGRIVTAYHQTTSDRSAFRGVRQQRFPETGTGGQGR